MIATHVAVNSFQTVPGGQTHSDPFHTRPPVQTGILLDDEEPLAELDDADPDEEPLDELHEELPEDDPLEELESPSHLQQPAPCQ